VRVRLVLMVLGLLLVPTVAVAGEARAATKAFSNASLACAWPIESTPIKANVAYPDSSATYWTTPYVAVDGLTITITGSFPTARYFSIQNYDSDAQLFTVNGVQSGITDFQIAPSTGSSNPWVAAGAANGGAYSVSVQTNVGSGVPNAIPLRPTTPATPLFKGLPAYTGFLMIRVYLPEGGSANDASVVPLPTLTFTRNGKSTTLQVCKNAQTTPSMKSQIRSAAMKAAIKKILGGGAGGGGGCTTTCPEQLSFFKAGSGSTPFPNANSGYAAALYQPAAGYISVVRATMPTSSTAAGSAPAPWPVTGTDLRYWSVCNYVYQAPFPVVKVGRVFGCLADEDVPMVQGVATVVLSAPADRPRATRGPRATIGWLPTSRSNTTARELVAVRNMLANTTFTQSAMSIPTANDPTAAESTMGVYYPEMTQCTIAVFKARGVKGCFATPSSPARS